jgi:hypothetical protein
LTTLFDANGHVTRWPRRAGEQNAILDFLSDKFVRGKMYKESEVNEIIKRNHTFGDWAMLRREMIERGRMARDAAGGNYWVIEQRRL